MELKHNCEHTCKGKCKALESALQQEKESIIKYAEYRDACDYPDIKVMLNEILILKQKILRLAEETKSILDARFKIVDEIQNSFNQ